MRTLDEIHDRIRGLLFKELQRRVDYATKRLPERCIYNRRNPLDERRLHEGDVNDGFNRVTSCPGVAVTKHIGLCMYGASNPEEWPGDICEDAIDAQRCPKFQPARTKEQILEEFTLQLRDFDWVEQNLPEVYTLMWVADSSVTTFHDNPLPWWVRLWWYFLRINLEPVRPGVDLSHYLPEAGAADGLHDS